MSRFYFDLYNGMGLTEDEEGQDLPNDLAARDCAVENIRSILSSEVKTGLIDFAGRIEIRRESGDVVERVLFTDAVRVSHGEVRT